MFSSLMAALAFVNPNTAYVSQSILCFLPSDPTWYRLALSWIPRYINFATILCIYACIYVYAQANSRKFGKGRRESDSPENSNQSNKEGVKKRQTKRYALAKTPELNTHGLLTDLRTDYVTKQATSNTPEFFIKSAFAGNPPFLPRSTKMRNITAPLKNPFTTDVVSQPLRAKSDGHDVFACDVGIPQEPSGPRSIPFAALPISAPPSPTSPASIISLRSRHWQSVVSVASNIALFAALKYHPHTPSPPSTPLSQLRIRGSQGEDIAQLQMAVSREKIRQQLGHQFIYPLIYIGMWTVPFASNMMTYTPTSPTYGIILASILSLTLQGAADCVFFALQEKPWRRMSSTSSRTSVGSFNLWSLAVPQSEIRRDSGSRDVEGQIIKLSSNSTQHDEVPMDAEQSTRVRPERNWWDAISDYDGTVSPITEGFQPTAPGRPIMSTIKMRNLRRV